MDNKSSNIKERILHLTDIKGIAKEKFFEKIGMSYGNFKGKSKNTPINSKAIEDIFTIYPDVNIEWLITGKPPMLNTVDDLHHAPPGRVAKKTNPAEGIKFYDVDFAAGDIEFYDDNNAIKPVYTMDIPEFGGCTAFRTYGDSMDPLIRPSSILFGTIIEDWHSHLEYGQIYGIVCKDKRKYLKYIRKFNESPKTHFLLRSENPEYDEFELPKDVIKSVWLIHGWINKRT